MGDCHATWSCFAMSKSLKADPGSLICGITVKLREIRPNENEIIQATCFPIKQPTDLCASLVVLRCAHALSGRDEGAHRKSGDGRLDYRRAGSAETADGE